MSGLVTLGETMGLFVATATGPAGTVDTFELAIGGAESNVAIGVARLGGEAAWIGRVGADDIGARVLRELRAEGVELVAAVDEGAPTGLMVKTRPLPGASRVRYYRRGSAGSAIGVADVERSAERIAAADVLHVTGITPALSPTAAAAVDAAVAIARDAGIAVSFDVNHRSALWDAEDAAVAYRSLAAHATILFAGADEAGLLVGAGEPEDLLDRLASLGPAQVVLKLGADGCLARIEGRSLGADAVRVAAVDTVGAGDAFVAAYLAELVAGADAEQRLATAVRAGAFACLSPADWAGYPTRPDLGLLDRGDPVHR